MKILVTGSAGFIGFHLVKSLIRRGDEVIGIDNINDYYDVNLKFDRLAETGIDRSEVSYGKEISSIKYANYKFIKLDLTDQDGLKTMFEKYKFDVVCNLAAQAGVRYSLENPSAYIESNIKGFLNILECCRNQHIEHLIYASSSSVYGLNRAMPFSVNHNVDHPVSLYAASKKSNELMAHAYSYLFGLPTTALRFFTVYGPWGRPDMALFLFSKAILENKPIRIFNNGMMKRDFTYIDDIVQGILKVIDKSPCSNLNWDGLSPDPSSSKAPYRILNIGRGHSVKLMDFVSAIEKNLGTTSKKIYCPLQEGDVVDTWADISKMKEEFSYVPQVDIEEGIAAFLDWYKVYYSYCNQEIVV
ncbi:NAD-dependent epimerase [Arcticibacter eurypsychrophilus]|uniref:NAD-dependent epimerase n=1 Tax=Arcticibacter eurypsychrophilus TaxID=1434752 RepID=UPI00084D355B|nr:NAD-dependent epimerase [Arcticibacter eurypsychrophilus]